MPIRAARVLLYAACLPVALAAQSPPTAETLRERATAYVEQFIARFSGIVAEERLVQESTSLPGVSGSGTDRRLAVPTPQRRELLSDFLFIRRAVTDDWTMYRDVFQVDGRPVRDRGDRLLKLLTSPSLGDEEMARAVARESSRFSLGSGGIRSVDNPLLALMFLQPKFHARFRFSRGGRDRKLGGDVWTVNYQEQARPTIVRAQGGDAPASGRLWIDAGTGRVLRSQVQAGISVVETSFAWDEALGVAVPVEMRDSYALGNTSFRGTATYSRLRRFDVTTSEQVQKP